MSRFAITGPRVEDRRHVETEAVPMQSATWLKIPNDEHTGYVLAMRAKLQREKFNGTASVFSSEGREL